jgi:hypothetical protein
MPLTIAGTTDLSSASRTSAYLPARGVIHKNMAGFNPSAATFHWAIHTIFSRVLFVLLIPKFFEFIIEEMLNLVQGDMLSGTASGRHMLRISHRHLKDALQTFMAHAMTARQFNGFGDEDIILKTGQAFNSDSCISVRISKRHFKS